MTWDIRNRRAVVTGAASGIGQATCCALAISGCDVVAVDMDMGEVGLMSTPEARFLDLAQRLWPTGLQRAIHWRLRQQQHAD